MGAYGAHMKTENDTLRADLARVTAERDRLAEREALFIKALSPVCDAGQYRADIVSAIERVIADRDALKARLDDYYDDHRAVVADDCATDEKHCSCVPHLRRELKALQEVLEAAEAVAALPPAGPLDLDDQTKWLALDNAIKVIRDRKAGG